MSLWSRLKNIVAKVFGMESAPQSPPPPSSTPVRKRPGVSRPVQQPKPKITRGELRHRRYGEVWRQVYEDLERSLPPTAIEDFNERESRFRALYDVWSDPSESDDIQLSAYEEFWDDMADFGYSIADFDWADFKQKYESLGG